MNKNDVVPGALSRGKRGSASGGERIICAGAIREAYNGHDPCIMRPRVLPPPEWCGVGERCAPKKSKM